MKKLLAILLTLTLVFGVASAMAEGIKLGIVTPDADHGFTGESVAHARAEAEALKASGAIEDYMMAVGNEASKQIQGIEEILNWGPDAIMLWPNEGDQLRNAAQTIVDEKIPLVIYDRLIENFTGMAAEIMGDNVKIGNMMGEYLLKYFEEDLKAGKEIKYLLFIGDSSTVSKQRTQGMLDVIDATEYKDQFVLLQDGFQTDWSNAKAKELMENWLSTADAATIADLDLIVTHDDEIIDGLMQVIPEETGLTDLRILTSVGGRRETLATFDNIEKPELLTYFFSPSYIREAIRLTVAAAKGETYQGQEIKGQQFLIPTIEIDKNTVEAYRNSQEFADRYSLDN
ncbi:MAG: substrate-binding domain-containing protein [Clostridiales bacterium]|nr:substrate-binding domain-containing protein [Clostridiales bacterium]